MVTILRKLRTIVLASAHGLLDKVIDEMSIPALRQNIRDLENAIDDLAGEAAVAEGSMKTAKDRLAEIQAQVTELNRTIDFILSDGDDSNDHLAEPLQARLIGLEEQDKTAKKEVETYRQTMEAVDKVVSALKAKHQSRLTQITLLESQAKTTEAKNQAAEAIEMASQIGDGPSVDSIAQKVTRKSNIADARLRRAMGDLETGLGQDALLNEAKARLAVRKAQLKK
ncbi:MAG: PspA/IM30 family protein [Patescibacteria group bacterium]